MKLKQTFICTIALNYIYFTSLGRYKSYLLEIKNSFLETFVEYKDFLTKSLGKENTFTVYGNYAMGAVDNLIETKTELEDLLNIFEKELSVYVRLNKFNSDCYTILPSNFSPATLDYVKDRISSIKQKDVYKTDEFFNNDFTLKKQLINEYNEYINDFKIHTKNTMEYSKTLISQVYSIDGFKINLE